MAAEDICFPALVSNMCCSIVNMFIVQATGGKYKGSFLLDLKSRIRQLPVTLHFRFADVVVGRVISNWYFLHFRRFVGLNVVETNDRLAEGVLFSSSLLTSTNSQDPPLRIGDIPFPGFDRRHLI